MPDTIKIPDVTREAAIDAALKQNWPLAIKINNELLKNNKTDINLLNRLGFAYLQNGQFTQSKKIFQKVTKLDPYNQIANKNLKKLLTIKRKDLESNQASQLSPLMFLEDPGKTKIAICINLAPNTLLSTLCAGQEVKMIAKKHTVEIRDLKNVYLGALPDDMSFKLIKFLAGGNVYKVLIKSVGKNNLVVFIRELERGRKFRHQPSFITPISSLPTSKIKPIESVDMTPTGEEEEESKSEE